MGKAVVVVGVVVLAAAGAGAYVWVAGRKPDLGPAGPNSSLAPASLAIYAEAPGLDATWTKVSATESWQDLAGSGIAAKLLESGPVTDLRAVLDQVAAKAEYPLTPRNVMKFVGRECSVGIELDPAGGAPRLLILTKLDVDALVKDFVIGGKGLDDLWTELQRRTGKCDFTVTAGAYRDHAIATAARPGATYHAALLGDTLAVATDAALLHKAVDCRIAKGEGSVGKRPEFQTDIAACGASPALVTWYDLAALDRGRGSLDAGLDALGAMPEVKSALQSVLDGTRGAPSFALATQLPDGDLYRATWTYSKGPELFADRAAPALSAVTAGDWMFYAEVRDAGRVVREWKASSLRRRLAGSEIGRWVDEFIDDPNKTLRGLAQMSPIPLTDLPDEDAASLVDRFAMRMGMHLAADRLGQLVTGDFATGVNVDLGKIGTGDPAEGSEMVAGIRLGTEGRLLALAALGMAKARPDSGLVTETVGARTVYHAAKVGQHAVLAGDVLVFGSSADAVRRAAGATDAQPAQPPAFVADSIAALEPGWTVLGCVETAKLFGAAGSARAAEMEKVFDLYGDLGVFGERVAYAAYVGDAMETLAMRSVTWLRPPKSPEGLAVRAALNAPHGITHDRAAPGDTIAFGDLASGGVPLIWAFTAGVVDLVGGDREKMLAGFRDALGMDVETELVPALGPELSISVALRTGGDDASAADAPIVVPALTIAIGVKDAAVVRRLVDRAVELIAKASEENGGQVSCRREKHLGADLVRFVLPEEGAPVKVAPALALEGDILLVSSDVTAIQEALAARSGKSGGLAASPLYTAARSLGTKQATAVTYLDWGRMIDQIAVYSKRIASSQSRSEVEFPKFPDDGDADEWQRRIEAYERATKEARASSAKAGDAGVKKWLDAARCVDFVVGDTTFEGDLVKSTGVIRFTR